MHPSSWKLLILAIYLCFHQLHGYEDKFGKNPSKVTDSKAKLAKTEILSPISVESHLEDENFNNESVSVLGITVPPEDANDTVQFDHHVYYNSTFYIDPKLAKQFWINLDSIPFVTTHEMLSNSHRQATTVDLKFEFPFYGNPIKNVTIATGGFLYMGDYLHNWIAATQFVAPLMANFDTSQSTESLIRYADNGTAFTVEWDKVCLKNKIKDGAFTFQVTLLKNGDIIFAYKEVPYPVSSISDQSHPVKIGISDAYILERSLFLMRRKTIYEYHRIDMLKKNIGNDTVLYLTALPTCAGYKDCQSCTSAYPKLECLWCNEVKRCSDGMDRSRQNWVINGCTRSAEKTCSQVVSNPTGSTLSLPNSIESSTVYSVKSSTSKHSSSTFNFDFQPKGNQSDNLKHEFSYYKEGNEVVSVSSVSVGAIITIICFIVAVIGALGWIGYAYKFPQTPSGQFLIKYRPSQWSLRKDDNNAVTTSSRHL